MKPINIISKLTEGQEDADKAYYLVNDAALKLQEVKPYIKEGTDADKLYTNIIIELNSLQMELHNTLLNETSNDFVEDKDINEPVNLETLGMCPYCTKKLTDNDKWFIEKYGMCQECFENGVE